MGVGVEGWDGGGNLIFSTDWIVSRYLGQFTIPQNPQTGSFVDANLSLGTSWWYPLRGMVGPGGINITPRIRVSGTTLSWDWQQIYSTWRFETIVLYGVYTQ